MSRWSLLSKESAWKEAHLRKGLHDRTLSIPLARYLLLRRSGEPHPALSVVTVSSFVSGSLQVTETVPVCRWVAVVASGSPETVKDTT